MLVGLGDVEVLGVDDEAGGPLRLHVRRRAERPDCGVCGGLLWSNGERPVELVDLPAFGRPTRLVWHKRRWRCGASECSASTVTEQDAAIGPPRSVLTTRAARSATAAVGRDGHTVGDVASELGCYWHTAGNAVIAWGEALLDADTERVGSVEALGRHARGTRQPPHADSATAQRLQRRQHSRSRRRRAGASTRRDAQNPHLGPRHRNGPLADVEANLDIQVFFCQPRSTWQRPSNEQTNGLLRRWLPNRTNLNCNPIQLALI